MIKKNIDVCDEEDIDIDYLDDAILKDTKEDEEDDIKDDVLKIDDDDDNIDIIIEIDDDDLDIIDNDICDDIDSEDTDVIKTEEDIILSKHKLEGKHSLKYDSIFKGKKEDPSEEESMSFDSYQRDTIEVDKTSNYYLESIDNENYVRSKLVKERVYEVLLKNTNINFLNNRRKPSKVDFNEYYNILRVHLKSENFTNIELFNELSVYFSDNLFNMFKLLDKKWRNLIIGELQEHIGKNSNSKEIVNRNIYEGTEIEFRWIEESTNNIIYITGDVIEIDYEISTFKVNSYERIYEVTIEMITKILNNTKFKYNLNKLSNVDFL